MGNNPHPAAMAVAIPFDSAFASRIMMASLLISETGGPAQQERFVGASAGFVTSR
jgi:hypothetical protein